MLEKVYIVQSANTGDFLYPSPETGDIGHTRLVTNAGLFFDFDEAVTAELSEIGSQHEFVVFGFMKEID